MSRLRSTGLRLAALGAVSAASLATLGVSPAAAADTTTVVRSGSQLTVTGKFSVANAINLTRSANGLFLNVSDVHDVSAGSGCQSTGSRSVQCRDDGISTVRITTGSGDYRVFVAYNENSVVLGGVGNDTLRSSNAAGSARLNGNDGDDRIFGADFDSLFGQDGSDLLSNGRFLRGGAGDDRLLGFDGNDELFGDEGFDDLDGGEGVDDLCATAEVTTNCEAF